MKRISILILFMPVYLTAYPQDQEFSRQITVGVFSGLGINQPVRLTRKYITEDVGPFDAGVSLATGLKLSMMIFQQFSVEIGAGYSIHKCKFELSPPIYPSSKIYSETLKTFFIPLTAYRYLKRDLFLSFGTLADFELPRRSSWIDSQNGLGFSVGAGKKFVVRNFEIDISPDIEIHSAIPFHSVKYQQRLLVFNLKAGLGFNLIKPAKESDDSALF